MQICHVSSVTKADLLSICSNENIRFCYNTKSSFICIPGDVLPTTPAYFASANQLAQCLEQLQKDDTPYVVLLGMHLVVLRDEEGNDLTIPEVTVTNAKHLLRLSISSARKKPITGRLTMELSNVFAGTAERAMGNSVMHKVQTNLYRIPKAIRVDVQQAVFAYLSGNAPQFGKVSQYPHLLTMLSSPEMQNLRRACRSIATIGITAAVKTYKVDAFDINFLLAQERKLEPEKAKLKAAEKKAATETKPRRKFKTIVY